MMSERFKVTKFEEPSGKTFKNYGATSAETDAEAKGKLLADSALPADSQRVVGGTPATIRQYPYSAALLRSNDFIHYLQKCGGTIVQRRFVMTAANCVIGDTPIRWRIRVGSVFANSGGVVHHTNEIILHPRYDIRTRDSDIAIVRTATDIIFNLNVGVARIAASTNNLNSHNIVQGIGWGATSFGGPHSETLQRVDLWVTDQIDCRLRYAEINLEVTQNMVCAGWLGVGGRDQCTGDNGSPLVLDGVVVGIRSWGVGCGNPRYPGVSTRMHRFSNWILENAINV